MNFVVVKNIHIPAGEAPTAFKIERLINMELGEEDIKHDFPGLVPDRVFISESDCSETLRQIIPGIETIEYINPEAEL